MPSAGDMLKAFENFMVDEAGLARRPEDTGALPPLYLEPTPGVPDPSDAVPLVLAAFKDTGLPPARYENPIRTDALTVWMRSTVPKLAYDFEPDLRQAINDQWNWTMGGLFVIETHIARDLQRIGYDEAGYTGNTQYYVQHYQY